MPTPRPASSCSATRSCPPSARWARRSASGARSRPTRPSASPTPRDPRPPPPDPTAEPIAEETAMRFEGRIALITAGARGIGRPTADIIAAGGGTVALVDTDKVRLDAAVAALQGAGGRAHGHRADALDPHQVDEVVKAVAAEHGRIDILLNAVGGSTVIARAAATVDELTVAGWQRTLRFN